MCLKLDACRCSAVEKLGSRRMDAWKIGSLAQVCV